MSFTITAPCQRLALRRLRNDTCKAIRPVKGLSGICQARVFFQKGARAVSSQASEVDSTYTEDTVDIPAQSSLAWSSGDPIKASLLDAITGTERGLVARSEVRAEINELINQLEVRDGQSVDVSSLQFEGTWELLYSNGADLLLLLSFNRLPLPFKIGAVTQTIDAAAKSVENSVQLQLPMIQTSVSTVSSYTMASPKRLQFTLERGVLHTPSIVGTLELPATITVVGQTLDLAPLRELLGPVTRGAASLAASASDLLGQAPDLVVQLDSKAWQITTYLDGELRVTRSDGGAVYIFKKVVKA